VVSDISNNNLAILLVLTAIVIVVGTVFSLYRINSLEDSIGITGAATGTVSLTVSSTAYITVSGSIDLGAIEPGEWNSSENASYTHGAAETNDGWNDTNITSNFTVQNDGSVPIDIEIYDENQTGNTPGKGPFTGTGGCIPGATCYRVRCLTVENNGTAGTKCSDGKQNNYTAMPVESGTNFAEFVNYTDSKDQAFFAINLTIPSDESTLTLSQSITFAGSAS